MPEIPDLDDEPYFDRVATLLEVAEAIDKGDFDCTDWEGHFLETVLPLLRAGRMISNKQEEILKGMKEKYL